MPDRIKIAWISDFPVEWLEEAPAAVRQWPRRHPAMWMRVLLEEWRSSGLVEPHVVVLRKEAERDFTFEALGARFHVLRTRGRTRAPSLFWTDTLMIRKLLERIQPGLVHAWGTERGAALVGARLNRPCLVTMQGLLGWYNSVLPPTAWQRFGAWMENRALRRARHVTTESRFAVNYLRQQHPHLMVHQVEHAPAWAFHAVRREPQTSTMRLMLTGHLDRRKGADVLFRALDALCGEMDFELVHAGSADQRLLAGLRRETTPEIWQRYRPLGSLAPAQIAAELARATLLVLPTRADTSPNAVKEAVVAGVPVVATAVGGIPDYVLHGENGWLIPSADAGMLAGALRATRQHPLLGRGQVTSAAHARMRDYLSPQRMAADFHAAYAAVLADARRN